MPVLQMKTEVSFPFCNGPLFRLLCLDVLVLHSEAYGLKSSFPLRILFDLFCGETRM
jgi:hypothetical protein